MNKMAVDPGERIHLIRKTLLSITLEEMEMLIGCSTSTFCKYEKGHRDITSHHLNALESASSISAVYIKNGIVNIASCTKIIFSRICCELGQPEYSELIKCPLGCLIAIENFEASPSDALLLRARIAELEKGRK